MRTKLTTTAALFLACAASSAAAQGVPRMPTPAESMEAAFAEVEAAMAQANRMNAALLRGALAPLGGAPGGRAAFAPGLSLFGADAGLEMDVLGAAYGPGDDYDDFDGPDGRRARVAVRLRADRGDHDLRQGQVPRLRLDTRGRGYAAVVQVDTDGRVSFLYPASPRHDGRVSGRRSIPLEGSRLAWRGQGRARPGVAYVMALASERPLRLEAFAGWGEERWDRDLYVRGDPYRALDRIAAALVRGIAAPTSADYVSYRVGGRERYPWWACYNDFDSWESDRQPRSMGCDVVERRLRRDPGYYEARSRRATLRGWDAESARLFDVPDARLDRSEEVDVDDEEDLDPRARLPEPLQFPAEAPPVDPFTR